MTDKSMIVTVEFASAYQAEVFGRFLSRCWLDDFGRKCLPHQKSSAYIAQAGATAVLRAILDAGTADKP